MIFAITSYFNFLRRSTNAHGVQSPFVYDFVTKCMYDTRWHDDYKRIALFRRKLLQNKRIISIAEFGAGSRVFRSNRRKVSEIAKNAGISNSRAKLIHRVVRYFQPEKVLELGTSVGLATSAMAMGNPNAKIFSVEGCEATASVAKNQFAGFGLAHIDLITGAFDQILPQLSGQVFDLIYFDGNHQKEATLKYFEMLLPTAKDDSVWIFDDIHWSAGMEQAWDEIKKHPAVTVSIDTYRWGFVFFRKAQLKEDFTIRP